MKLHSGFFYLLARFFRDIEVLLSGSPKKIVRRQKNKYIGRRMGKIWRFPF